MKLSNILLEDFNKFKQESEKLESELKDAYNRDDIHVNIGQYHGRDRGFGKVTFQTQDELPPVEWKSVKNFLAAKGFEITDESNFFDTDDDRYYYPSIKFEFDANEAI